MQAVPKIKIKGAAEIDVSADQQVQVEALADFSSCTMNAQISFVWTQAATDAHTLPTDTSAWTSKGAMLIVKAGKMSAGQTYSFLVEGYFPDRSL